MKAYFALQYTMTNRKLNELGIPPPVAYFLVLVTFVCLCEYLFYKTEFAKSLLLFAVLSVLLRTSESKRNEFLLLLFGTKKYHLVRIIENLVLSLPFAIVLAFHHAFLEAVCLFPASTALSLVSFKNNFNYSFPTPFYKKPFEFAVGFRNTFYLFILAYFVTVMAILVDNLNLGLGSILLAFLVSLSYYLKPEDEYIVWSHAMSPARFLFEKLKTATLYISFLALPIILGLASFYPEKITLVLLFSLIGFAYLWCTILAKYAAYPHEMNLPEGLPLAFSIFFPPLLLAVIPFFYTKSLQKLNRLLS